MFILKFLFSGFCGLVANLGRPIKEEIRAEYFTGLLLASLSVSWYTRIRQLKNALSI